MHHSEVPLTDQQREAMRAVAGPKARHFERRIPEGHTLGATGRTPQDQGAEPLTDNDRGEIRYRIHTTKEGKIVVDYGTPVAWVGMTPEQASDHIECMIAALDAVLPKGHKLRGYLGDGRT